MTLRLGDIAPNFQQQSSQGDIDFYGFLGNSWGILFSHPADYTPVCTTELGYTAKLKDEFDKRDVEAGWAQHSRYNSRALVGGQVFSRAAGCPFA